MNASESEPGKRVPEFEKCTGCGVFMLKAYVDLEEDGPTLAKGRHHVAWYCSLCGEVHPA